MAHSSFFMVLHLLVLFTTCNSTFCSFFMASITSDQSNILQDNAIQSSLKFAPKTQQIFSCIYYIRFHLHICCLLIYCQGMLIFCECYVAKVCTFINYFTQQLRTQYNEVSNNLWWKVWNTIATLWQVTWLPMWHIILWFFKTADSCHHYYSH